MKPRTYPSYCTSVILATMQDEAGGVIRVVRSCGKPAVGGYEATAWCKDHSKPPVGDADRKETS